MESAIRIINLALAARLNPQTFKAKWIEYEYEFIQQNLESGHPNNHYLFNLLGLEIGSTLLNEKRNREKEHELIKEIDRQFNQDGTHFESSTAYHLLCLEAIAWAAIFSQEFRLRLRTLHDKLKRAVQFAEDCFYSNTDILQIGDDDGSCCVLPLESKNQRYFQLIVVQQVFGKSTKREASGVTTYPKFGLGRLKQGDLSIWLCATANGQGGKGGHSHNDKLSLNVCVENECIIGDPGVFLYSKYRNLFRSTFHHSALHLINQEQNELTEGRFILRDRVTPELKENANGIQATIRQSKGVLKRQVLTTPDGFTALDEFCNSSDHAQTPWGACYVCFTRPEIIKQDNVLIRFTERLCAVIATSDISSTSLDPIKRAPSYGTLETAWLLTVIYSNKKSKIETRWIKN
jgi:hypothetical protein